MVQPQVGDRRMVLVLGSHAVAGSSHLMAGILGILQVAGAIQGNQQAEVLPDIHQVRALRIPAVLRMTLRG